MPFAKPDAEPVYLSQMKALLARIRTRRSSGRTPVWGESSSPSSASAELPERSSNHIDIVEGILTDPRFARSTSHISWDEVAKYAVATPDNHRANGAHARPLSLIVFLFGDRHGGAGGSRRSTTSVYDLWQPVWRLLTPETSTQGAKGELRADLRRSAPARSRMGTLSTCTDNKNKNGG
jgi:hypothetical protein